MSPITTRQIQAKPKQPAAKPWKPILSHKIQDPALRAGNPARRFPRGISRTAEKHSRILTRDLPSRPYPTIKAQEQADAAAPDPLNYPTAGQGGALRPEPAKAEPAPRRPGRPRKEEAAT